ncbi:hypothetical protein C8R43DRAFT_1228818 [Mycena crocata]|nr:hypothetical protein C8R43DRAFT_1228818 [Mycena crocata]
MGRTVTISDHCPDVPWSEDTRGTSEIRRLGNLHASNASKTPPLDPKLRPESIPATHLEWFLSTCSRIEMLCMFHVNLEHHLSAIGNLKPKRIHCELRHIFEPDAQINLTHPSFSEVTHLELFDVLPSAAWSRLSLIPHLTHLALNDIPSDPFFRLVLDACASLGVLILLDMGPGDLPEPPEDPRIVLMNCHDYTKDWQMGAHTGVDFWSRAEDFIAKRRSGDVPALQYRIEGDESWSLN